MSETERPIGVLIAFVREQARDALLIGNDPEAADMYTALLARLERAEAPSRTDAFMAIGAFCRHHDGCPQLTDAAGCTCGLLKAQNDLLAALYRIEPESVPPVASAPTLCQPDPAIEQAFKAGYHCSWTGHGYVFDAPFRPGDPDGAFTAWRTASPSPLHAETREADPNSPEQVFAKVLYSIADDCRRATTSFTEGTPTHHHWQSRQEACQLGAAALRAASPAPPASTTSRNE